MNLPPPPFVLLEDSKSQSRANAGLLFAYPERILEAASLGDIPPLLAEIEKLQVGGKYLAGWLAYEAGFAFHPTLARQRAPLPREPLAWIGVFGPPQGLTTAELDRLFAGLDPHGQHVDFKCGESRRVFAKKFKKIQAHIAAGDIYQVNHTFRLEGRLGGSPFRLYGNLRCSQPVPYGAFIDTGAWRVLSFSPELFLMRRGNLLVSKPMKGTAPCGRTWDELQANGAALAADPKNRAENLMITDLIRNDISRVAEPGSVRVRRPFHVERFGRVLQMTSEVRGKLKKSIGFARVFEALFPCGSVTGAPKVRAMEIIAGTESAPRGVYTGALGFWAPGGNFTLNIPIRTLVLDREGRGRFGTGSGIVADSTLPGEYEECLLKARFLSETRQPFALIETLLWRGEHGFEFLDAHLERMAASAKYFGFAFDEKKIRDALKAALRGRVPAARQRVRLTCDRHGHMAIERKSFTSPPRPAPVAFSRVRVDSSDPFLYHKTTRRGVYAKAWQSRPGNRGNLYDMLLLNERGEVTEGTFNSVFVLLPGGRLATPPLSCGLLPGILRRHLLETGKIIEQKLKVKDVERSQRLFLGNSVSGLVAARLV